jgi:hypothetical protein
LLRVFLFDESVVVFRRSRLRMKGRDSRAHQISVALLINSEPLSLWNSKTGRGREDLTSERAWKVHFWALLRRGWSSSQPEETSVAVKVCTYWPAVACPQ